MPNINYIDPTGKKAIYFSTNWACYGRNFQISDIPETVTDIYYSFHDVTSQGNVLTRDSYADTDKRYTDSGVKPFDSWNETKEYYGNFGQFKKLKDSGRKINIHLAVAGWTFSKYFSDAVSTVNTRKTFITDLINTFKKYDIFSGVSLDWEYPSNDGINYGNEGNIARPEDDANFLLLIKELRTALNTNGMDKYLITTCCVADADKVKFSVEKYIPYIDLFLLMTYDYHGFAGESVCLHHTNPRPSKLSKFSCEGAADYFLSRGVPSTKICIGAAFYSRGYTNSDGFEKAGKGLSSDMSWEAGVVDYKDLPKEGAIEYLDPISKGAYSYDPVKRILNTYDNKESIIEKCKIVYEKNLAGIIVWENSGDKKDYNDPRNLTRVLRDNLTHGTPQGVSTTIPVKPPTIPITIPVKPPQQTPVVPPRPTTNTPITNTNTTTSKVMVSPYFFTWAFENTSQQKFTSLMQVKRDANVKAVTLAFIISGGDGIVSGDVDNMISDVKAFISAGGYVTISFGGAAGTYIENSTNENAIFNSIDSLLQRTGVRSVDFDVEGGQLANSDMNTRRANVLVKLQTKYPNLNIRITLPVMPYHNEWNLGGVPDIALNLLKTTCNAGVKINTVNLMTMDYGNSYAVRAGDELAISSVEATVKQLKTIPYFASKSNVYNYIGICPMIGQNDDANIFKITHAEKVAEYANKKGVSLISYWGLQRDRAEKGTINDYSSHQTADYQFYKAFNKSFGTIPPPVIPSVPAPVNPPTIPTVKPPTTTPVKPPTIPTVKPPTTTPVPTNSDWKLGSIYKIGDEVIFNNKRYECLLSHTVSDLNWTPQNVPALWKEIPIMNNPSSDSVSIFNWSTTGSYKKGDIIKYNNVNYQCLLNIRDTPNANPILWKKV